jgi:hypothetical protein
MDLAGKYIVVWLSPEAIETFLGVLEPAQEHARAAKPRSRAAWRS